jgi:Protein of unknown function (DUF742)
LLRPYVLTGGRTQSSEHLGVERLVTATPLDPRALAVLGPQALAVYQACMVRSSIAEIAARAGLPLGVVRVLVGDLVRAKWVQVHPAANGPVDLALLERVLHGLDQLS